MHLVFSHSGSCSQRHVSPLHLRRMILIYISAAPCEPPRVFPWSELLTNALAQQQSFTWCVADFPLVCSRSCHLLNGLVVSPVAVKMHVRNYRGAQEPSCWWQMVAQIWPQQEESCKALSCLFVVPSLHWTLVMTEALSCSHVSLGAKQLPDIALECQRIGACEGTPKWRGGSKQQSESAKKYEIGRCLWVDSSLERWRPMSRCEQISRYSLVDSLLRNQLTYSRSFVSELPLSFCL